jgi:SAM-dependent methyltransferase
VGIRELQKSVEEVIFVGQAHRLGIFDELHAKPDNSRGMASRKGYDERVVRVLLEALVEMGYLESREGAYHITPLCRERLIDRDGPGYEGDFWQFLYYLINPWRTLEHVLVTGAPDKESYRDFNMDHFIRGMDSPWKKRVAPEIADLCIAHAPGAETVADIGGAPGTIARVFAGRGLRTIVYDLPESLAVMKNELAAVKNIVVEEGDATKSLPAGTWDIAFLGNLCHGQSPEDNAKIIYMCREHLAPGGIIAIFDNIRGMSSCGATLALHMITQSPRGNVYSRDEYYGWIDAAGFNGTEVLQLSDPAWQLIIARK